MKKTFAILLTALLAVMVFMPIVSAAEPVEFSLIDEDIEITQEEIEMLEHVSGEIVLPVRDIGIQALASSNDLISSYSVTLAKSGSQLIIRAETKGATSVTKSGFTYVVLQRYVNGSWQDYSKYYDQYQNATNYTFSKAITATKGYSYRVVCEHYAEKKTLLIFTSKQYIYNQTGSLAF